MNYGWRKQKSNGLGVCTFEGTEELFLFSMGVLTGQLKLSFHEPENFAAPEIGLEHVAENVSLFHVLRKEVKKMRMHIWELGQLLQWESIIFL